LTNFLGVEVAERGGEFVRTTMPASEWFANIRREVEPGILSSHAGVTAALVIAGLTPEDHRAFTFEVTTSFLTPIASDGRLVESRSHLHSRTGDITVLETESFDADGHRILAGRGTQLIRPRRNRVSRRPSNRVLLTVLFTDVVGSTERLRALGDARWREILAEHDDIVRRQTEASGGRIIKSTGDGVLATFDSPSRAVTCARAIRDGVRRLGLELRAGIHSGECEVTVTDVAGLAVHVASRIEASAATGEILVSGTVRDLVSGTGIALTDRGTHVLKGLDGEWVLYAVAD
jgi:class 3 adenylate cyclase